MANGFGTETGTAGGRDKLASVCNDINSAFNQFAGDEGSALRGESLGV